MANVSLVLLAFAFVFACFLSFGQQAMGRFNILGLVLAFWIGASLFGGLARVFLH